MSSFFGSSSPGATPLSTDPAMTQRTETLKNQIRSEVVRANGQQLLDTINEKCYITCIKKPSTSLSRSEETCLSNCMDRYLEAFNIVSKTYVARLGREFASSGSLSS